MEDPASTTVMNINDMPPEILLQIFYFLESPSLSETRLHDQPSGTLLDTEPELRWLGPASLVCKTWRSLALPKLFRHVLWRPQVSSLSAFTLNPIPLLRFLEDHGLERSVRTFTLVVDFADEWADTHRRTPQIRSVDLEWFWDQIFSVVDPLRFTIIAPPTTLAAFLSRMLFLDDAWSFDMPYHILSLSRTEREDQDPFSGRSQVDASLSGLGTSAAKSDGSEGSKSHLAAAAAVNAAATTGSSGNATSSSSSSCRPSRRRRAPPCPLFTARRWTGLLLNEGSSTKVYRTYEFFLRRPPSMLGALLGCEEWPNDAPLVPPSVVDLSYVAIFPLSAQVRMLLEHLPRIDRLFVQLGPASASSRRLLEDPAEMRHVDPADLWMERDSAYSYLIREISTAPVALPPSPSPSPSPQATSAAAAAAAAAPARPPSALTSGRDSRRNWALLRVFESGDDKEAMDLACRSLVDRPLRGWRIEGDGRVFVKCGYDNENEAGAATAAQGGSGDATAALGVE
ncbi:hypothetical protein SLS62_002364 [Diatrype stigma]|uniref:F-box domain-containing protein n=1 Tax=Diatrype stigma TaxID=117547 RepID=A0AAN9YSJ3_9PEZI